MPDSWISSSSPAYPLLNHNIVTFTCHHHTPPPNCNIQHHRGLASVPSIPFATLQVLGDSDLFSIYRAFIFYTRNYNVFKIKVVILFFLFVAARFFQNARCDGHEQGIKA
ncbi:hypothetical protein Lser_V15G39397 [Lactuca serriola]